MSAYGVYIFTMQMQAPAVTRIDFKDLIRKKTDYEINKFETVYANGKINYVAQMYKVRKHFQ